MRLYQFGSVPISLDWDEVSLAYNALSLWQTSEDEYGNHLPFSIRSFNDYKPPLYAYLLAPMVGLLGKSEAVVRLPALISGLLALLIVYRLTLEHLSHKSDGYNLALLATGVVATMPWHVLLSRAGFESGLGVTLLLLVVYAGLKWKQVRSIWWLMGASIFSVLAMYSYHAPRLLVPLLAIGFGVGCRQLLISRWKQGLLALLFVTVGLVPLAVISTRGAVASRFTTVSIFTNPGEFSRERELAQRMSTYQELAGPAAVLYSPLSTSIRIMARNYLDHFSANFLLTEGDGNARHSIMGFGMLTWFQVLGLVVGITELKKKHWWLILALLVAPIPASLTADTPHAIRAFAMAPFLGIVSALGLSKLLAMSFHPIFKTMSFLLAGAMVVTTLILSNVLFTSYPTLSARDWQYGYRQVIEWLADYPEMPVFLTNHYDQPHIYVAWYQPVEIHAYQAQAETASATLGWYRFGSVDREALKSFAGYVVVEPERSLDGQTPEKTIFFPDGSEAFKIYRQSL